MGDLPLALICTKVSRKSIENHRGQTFFCFANQNIVYTNIASGFQIIKLTNIKIVQIGGTDRLPCIASVSHERILPSEKELHEESKCDIKE